MNRALAVPRAPVAAARAVRPSTPVAAVAPQRSPLRCACGGGCPGCVQPKLKLDRPGDRWEQEADRVADALLAGRDARPTPAASAGLTQRLSSLASPAPEDAEIGDEEEAETPVQRLAAAGDPRPSDGWTRGLQAAPGGQPLPRPLATNFGERLGADLGAVRVHADGHAAALCDGIAARAFTHGRDIFFNRGEYRPGERSGQHVLAHELAHVLQQGGAQSQVQRLSVLNQTTPQNLLRKNVRPWGGTAPSGNDYKVQTDAGNDISGWVAYSGTPEADRYWCHGFSLGSYASWGYSVWSGGPMGQVVGDEFRRVGDADAKSGDIAVWMSMPDGKVYGHSARFTQPVVSGSALDDAQSRLDSKNGNAALGNFSLAELKAIPDYGVDVGVFRHR